LSDAFKTLANSLEDLRGVADRVGRTFKFIFDNISALALQIEYLFKEPLAMLPIESANKRYKEAIEKAQIKFKSWEDIIEEQRIQEEKITKQREKEEQDRIKIQEDEETRQQDLLAGERLREEELKHQIALMKILGATEVEIARFRLESLEAERAFMTDAEYRIQRQLRLNALIQEEAQRKEEVRKIMENLYVEYMKAEQAQDKEAKERVRSLMEALTLTPEQTVIWWRTATDEWRNMILESFDLLSEEQKEALKEYWEATRQFPKVEIFSPVTRLKKQIGEDIPNTFWENWIEKMMTATDKFRERFLGIIEEETTVTGKPAGTVSAEEQFVADWKKYYKERGMKWGIEEEAGFRKVGKGLAEPEKPTETHIEINISRIDAKGVTKKEVEDAIPGALAKAIEREEIIKKIRRRV